MTKSRLNLGNMVKSAVASPAGFKSLRNVAMIACLTVTSMVFSSCDKGEDPNGNSNNASKITATNVINSSSQIATVKVKSYWETEENWGSDVIAQAPYKNNGFTLELPTTVSDKYLDLLAEGAPNGITISDKTVKYMEIDIEAYNGDENNIGGFYLADEEESDGGVMWLYVDKNVTIKGEEIDINGEGDEEYISKYDMDLKKGWNIVYSRETKSHNNSTGRDVYTHTMTTQKPSGVNYQWYFYSYDYESWSVKAGTKSAVRKNSFFQNIRGVRK